MTTDRLSHYAALTCMGVAVITGAIVANAPTDFALLWELKTATAAFTGLAGLFLKPPSAT